MSRRMSAWPGLFTAVLFSTAVAESHHSSDGSPEFPEFRGCLAIEEESTCLLRGAQPLGGRIQGKRPRHVEGSNQRPAARKEEANDDSHNNPDRLTAYTRIPSSLGGSEVRTSSMPGCW